MGRVILAFIALNSDVFCHPTARVHGTTSQYVLLSFLSSAPLTGLLQIVQLLIERGCQYNAQNNEGFTPSDYAYSYVIPPFLRLRRCVLTSWIASAHGRLYKTLHGISSSITRKHGASSRRQRQGVRNGSALTARSTRSFPQDPSKLALEYVYVAAQQQAGTLPPQIATMKDRLVASLMAHTRPSHHRPHRSTRTRPGRSPRRRISETAPFCIHHSRTPLRLLRL